MKKLRIFATLVLLMTVLIACGGKNDQVKHSATTQKNADQTRLTISAAISLTDALEEIKAIYEANHPVELSFNLGSSGKLAQQIQQGAPADVFISANQDWMDTLEAEEEIISDTRDDITGNQLVLITGKDATIDYSSFHDIDTADIDQLAIGNPESVPAGKYTEQTLKNLDLWDTMESKFVLAKDVRQVLTYVETGNADIGFVYESDALSSDKIKILAAAETGMHDPIIYPGAVIADSPHVKEAKAFMEFMATDTAQHILAKHGFTK